MRCCGYTITFEKKGMEDVLFIKKNVYMYVCMHVSFYWHDGRQGINLHRFILI